MTAPAGRRDTICGASRLGVRYIECMDTPAARLRHLRESRSIGSAAELARRLGIPEVTYRAHESGVRGFGEVQARRYAETLEANWVWLLTGTGEPFAEPPAPIQPPTTAPNKVRVTADSISMRGGADLPVYASAEGGPSGMIVTHDPIDWIVRPEALANVRDGFAVYVIGTSMEPRYEHGDMIVVHPSRPVQRNDDILLLSAQEDGTFAALIKRLANWNDAAWTVRQYNPAKEYDLPRREWQRAHVVLGRFNRR